MAELGSDRYRALFEAVAFAARAHDGQRRKDKLTPYVSHPFRVALVVREVFGIDDLAALTAAVLHDAVEDTTTDFDDIRERFGGEVACLVAALSKDKRLPETDREKAYEDQLASAPWQAKVCKLADIFDNLNDMSDRSPAQQGKTVRNAHRYLSALKEELPEQVRRAWQIVSEHLARREHEVGGSR